MDPYAVYVAMCRTLGISSLQQRGASWEQGDMMRCTLERLARTAISGTVHSERLAPYRVAPAFVTISQHPNVTPTCKPCPFGSDRLHCGASTDLGCAFLRAPTVSLYSVDQAGASYGDLDPESRSTHLVTCACPKGSWQAAIRPIRRPYILS